MTVGDPFAPRSEAAVLAASEVTDEQERAGNQLFQLLSQMAASREAVDKPVPQFLPRIDPKRTNRVLLLDGKRGSGKTALLVTLLHVWRRAFTPGPDEKLAAPLSSWDDPSGAIVPVGLLDLHPLPPSTNLLFHIIGRFERVVEWLESDGVERPSAAWHFQGQAELPSRKKWQLLLRAVAAGWDGSVQDRAARLDLEAYMTELEEAERQRLNLVETFADFMDTLVADFMKRRGNVEPMFVLAIDDADMDPAHAVSLLDTVRMLWHSRVAFILTGDSDLFVAVLVDHCLGDLRRIANGETAHRQLCARLAHDIYDKVIPIGHRCSIAAVPPARRLALLEPALQLVALERPGPAPADDDATRPNATLADLFRRDGDVHLQLAEVLPDRLRGIIGLKEQCKREASRARSLGPETPVPAPASRIVEVLWRQALEANPDTLNPDALYIDARTGALRLRFDSGLPGLGFPVPYYTAELHVAKEPRVQILRATHLQALGGSEVPLPGEVTAALMLASDLATEQREGRWDSVPTGLTGFENLFAQATYRAAVSPERLAFPWPLPAHYPFSFYAAFQSRWRAETRDLVKRWNAAARGRGDKGANRRFVDEAAQRFLRLVLHILRTDPKRTLENMPLDWKGLAEEVAVRIDRGGTSSYRWALARAPLFAAPEYGLSAEAANQWLNALAEATPFSIEAVRRERRNTPALAFNQMTERVLQEIDGECEAHDWSRIVEQRRTKLER